MEITLEKLIAAGNDLNNVLKLEPPINTVFTTELKGGAAKAVEAKFMRGLQAEIIQLAEFEDKETGKFDLQPGDLPLLQPETLETIFKISPKTKERLGSQQEAPPHKKEKIKKEKAPKKEKEDTPFKNEGKGDFIKSLIAEGKWTKKEVIQMGVEKFSKASKAAFASSISHAKNPKYLKVFGKLVEEVKSGDGEKMIIRFINE